MLSAGNTKIKVNILCDTGAHPNLLKVKSKCQHNKSHIIGFPCIGPGKLIMVKTASHVKFFSKKITVKYSGLYHVAAFVKNCVLLCDMENNVLPDLKPIRSLTKIDSYMENFPRDRVRVNEIKDLKLQGEVNPGVECGEQISVNAASSMQCELTLTEKFKRRGNQRFVLAYPFNCKPSGVWIPTNFVEN